MPSADRTLVSSSDSDSESVEAIVVAAPAIQADEDPKVKVKHRIRKAKASKRPRKLDEPSTDSQSVATAPSTKHKAKDSQRPLILVGCLVAAAVATACFRQWFQRRKLKPKTQNIQNLITKCNLQPSEAVLTASPHPPLKSTAFVVSQV